MAWIESHTTLREHPKRKRLSRLLAINARETIGLLHILWWWVLDFAPEGDLSAYSDEDIADSIDWEGDAGHLVAALTQAGFMDEDRQVHDWDEFAEKWIARRRANAERMRLARAGRNANGHSKGSAHVQNTSDARAPQNAESVGLPDQPTNRTNQPDLTNQPDQPTGTSPQPPPLAEGGRSRRRERSNGTSHDAESGPAAQAVVTPPSPDDEALWSLALEAIRDEVPTPAWRSNVETFVQPLIPIGRAADGGLHLRAPPGQASHSQRFKGYVARALCDAGDANGANVAIVEGRSPEG